MGEKGGDGLCAGEEGGDRPWLGEEGGDGLWFGEEGGDGPCADEVGGDRPSAGEGSGNNRCVDLCPVVEEWLHSNKKFGRLKARSLLQRLYQHAYANCNHQRWGSYA